MSGETVLRLISAAAAVAATVAVISGMIGLMAYGILDTRFMKRVRREAPDAHRAMGSPSLVSKVFAPHVGVSPMSHDVFMLLDASLQSDARRVDRLRRVLWILVVTALSSGLTAIAIQWLLRHR